MRELVLHCLEAQAEALSDALLEAGVLSVSVEDADSDTEAEQPLFGEPGTEPEVQAWHRNRVVALLPDGADPEQILEQVRVVGGADYLTTGWFTRDVPDADWVRLTQAQFRPIQVGKRVWIVPSWHRDDPEVPDLAAQAEPGGPIHLQLDPGLAFGTGSHPTTHLCLEWLEANLQPGESLLDYGCGSGILAIAAKMLGAGPTLAVDIDEQAVVSTRYNAQINHVELQALLPDALPAGQLQLVVANILSNPLKVLAPMLAGRVQPGGRLVLSGVLERQADEVAQAYAPWLSMSVWRAREGWVCLHGQRS
ncbi:50S ribosomal protein L11 methyltransferase [Eoetvoesiella caeni]|uniref:Ribosomal protein L11 methyltransferase n=1 Tax=Eoetvoesiella caeni TaxID=645616 RepID=A0A366HCI7_9BURK|nr:50S ribosomal protein L11 methyltransferase [Eoetvoesiella caeni]MCI2809010.1 50S ribosomal protein L11 methyltransferase [Eoetvoesiella caeni]NYT55489.1 50S ribosomal protein L11 methyltransferase [Eoetvoesiella caeni]RBP40044.1 [LSU ribosomal protein L11P]-lysine N-methyltransferase [Eoetvoesiella caeni]